MKSPMADVEQQHEEHESSGMNLAKYATIISTVAAIGFIGVTTVSNMSASAPASSTTFSALAEMAADRPTVPEYTKLSTTEQYTLFQQFQSNYGRHYSDDTEKKTKYDNFISFLKNVDSRNAVEKARGSVKNKAGAIHGITRFADMSDEEFQAMLGYKAPAQIDSSMKKVVAIEKYTGSTTEKDWTGILTTAVKDQGYCGSCWAFSATEQIESDAIRSEILTTKDTLAPQQIVSCDEIDYGCKGGNTETAYVYVKRNGGLTSSDTYPYTSYMGSSGVCKSNFNKDVTITSYSTIASEDEMISYVLTTGPLSICADASQWSTYVSGIVTTCGQSVDHCIQVVGVNTEEGYWKVRNSWGTTWGESGYIRLATGENMCNIAYDPTYVTAVAL